MFSINTTCCANFRSRDRLEPRGRGAIGLTRDWWPGKSAGARKAIVHRAVSSGEVSRLKPGLYCLSIPFRRTSPHPFAVAGLLLSPSHISLESALWHYELIPESVSMVTSVTTLRSRSFTTPLGNFAYKRVPADHSRAGTRAVEVDRGIWAFIATPLRAIADLVYLRRDLDWRRDGLGWLTDSLRIELDDLVEMPLDDVQETLGNIRSKRTTSYLTGMLRELGR